MLVKIRVWKGDEGEIFWKIKNCISANNCTSAD